MARKNTNTDPSCDTTGTIVCKSCREVMPALDFNMHACPFDTDPRPGEPFGEFKARADAKRAAMLVTMRANLKTAFEASDMRVKTGSWAWDDNAMLEHYAGSIVFWAIEYAAPTPAKPGRIAGEVLDRALVDVISQARSRHGIKVERRHVIARLADGITVEGVVVTLSRSAVQRRLKVLIDRGIVHESDDDGLRDVTYTCAECEGPAPTGAGYCMHCDVCCGRACSEWTGVEWYSDNLCGGCHDDAKADAADPGDAPARDFAMLPDGTRAFGMVEHKDTHSHGMFKMCPRCGKEADGAEAIEEEFGFRKCKSKKHGAYLEPQPWCRACRTDGARERRALKRAEKAAAAKAAAERAEAKPAKKAKKAAKPPKKAAKKGKAYRMEFTVAPADKDQGGPDMAVLSAALSSVLTAG